MFCLFYFNKLYHCIIVSLYHNSSSNIRLIAFLSVHITCLEINLSSINLHFICFSYRCYYDTILLFQTNLIMIISINNYFQYKTYWFLISSYYVFRNQPMYIIQTYNQPMFVNQPTMLYLI